MSRQAVRQLIEQVGVIPSVRMTSEAEAQFAAEVLHEAGIPIIEITMTTPKVLELIASLVKAMPNLLVGASTVLERDTARRCADAGAQFISSPGFDSSIVELTLKSGIFALPGAVTPTEIMAARQAGADAVKVFPCAEFGGPHFIRALKDSFADIPFVAAGGVTQQTAADYIRAGAMAIGVGSALIPRRAVHNRDRHWITELAHRFLQVIQHVRVEGLGNDPGD
jgi:2-dehydro-3-deoxyphosphogluconate aldolase/(4S)-4-hydroxy-2-oxoglutarate aldolase